MSELQQPGGNSTEQCTHSAMQDVSRYKDTTKTHWDGFTAGLAETAPADRIVSI